MFAEMSFEIEAACAKSGDCGAGLVDLIGDALGFRLIAADVSLGLKSFKIVECFDDTFTTSYLARPLDPNVHGFDHGQPGGVPIGGVRVGGDGHSGTTHPSRTGTDDDKFHGHCRRRHQRQEKHI